MSTLTTVKSRAEIPAEDRWDVEALYPSFDAWKKDFQRNQPQNALWKALLSCQGHLGEGDHLLKKALEARLGLERQLEKLYTYAHLRHDEDVTEVEAKNAYEKISFLYAQFHKEFAWFEPELLALPAQVCEKYLNDSSLATYKFYLEKIIRYRPHTLSASEEKLLAMASKPFRTPSKAFSALNNADIEFKNIHDSSGKEHPLTHGLYQLYMRNPDRKLRENAFLEMMGRFSAYENTLAELISGEVERHYFTAQARHFPSCLDAALFPHNVPLEVYHALIQSVRKGLPILHKYVALRKKVLKLNELHLFDMQIPMVKDVEFSMSYAEAEKVVIDSVAPLGREYQEALRRGMATDRWVDRYENQNKRSGAYSSGCYDSHPYILMNYRGTLRDVFTLAHEAGHSMHSFLSHQNQPYHDASYPIFVAEVASTFNEELLMHHLLARAQTKPERLFLINEKMEDIRGTLFRQAMFAEFELTLHQLIENETPLTPTLLKELFYKLNKEYFGPDLTLDSQIAIEWARIPHFYYNFYVYQYSTGISAALSLAERVLAHTPSAAETYINFLKKGGGAFPIDLLKTAGIDMTSPTPVDAAIHKFDSLLTQFEQLL